MIIRLSSTLAKKIKETDLPSLPPDPNLFADWVARLFTANRAQYILITNSASLYSVVIFGKGVTYLDSLMLSMTGMMRDVMKKDGFDLLYEKQVAPATAGVSLSRAVNRSVIGSMNDLVYHAKLHLTSEELSPYGVSFRLNELPMSALKYQTPREAFPAMTSDSPLRLIRS